MAYLQDFMAGTGFGPPGFPESLSYFGKEAETDEFNKKKKKSLADQALAADEMAARQAMEKQAAEDTQSDNTLQTLLGTGATLASALIPGAQAFAPIIGAATGVLGGQLKKKKEKFGANQLASLASAAAQSYAGGAFNKKSMVNPYGQYVNDAGYPIG